MNGFQTPNKTYTKEEVLAVLSTFEQLLHMNRNNDYPSVTGSGGKKWAESYREGIRLMHKLLEVKCKCQK